MSTNRLEQELKRGSAELLVLALLEQQERYGYEISRLINERSEGAIVFHVTSLYPTLYRLERKGLIEGRWVVKKGQRRRRCTGSRQEDAASCQGNARLGKLLRRAR